MPRLTRTILTLALIQLLLSGCRPAEQATTPPAQTASQTNASATAILPSATATHSPVGAAPTPVPTPTLSPTLPGLVPAGAVTRIGKGAITALAAGPDFLAVGSSIGICLYELPDFVEGWCAAAPGAVQALAITRDGVRLAAGTADGDLLLWDLAGRIAISERKVSSGGPFSLAFSPDGATLAVTEPGQITTWDGLDLSRHETVSTGPAFYSPIAFSPDGRYLAWIDHPQTVDYLHIQDLQSGEPFGIFDLPLWSRSLAWMPDSTAIIAGQAGDIGCYENCDTTLDQTIDGGLFIYDLARHESNTITFNIDDAAVDRIALSPVDNVLAIWLGSLYPRILLLDQYLAQPEPIPAVPHPFTREMAWDRTGQTLYFLDAAGGISAWTLGGDASTDVTPPGYGTPTWLKALSPDGSLVASYNYLLQRRIEIRSVPDGALLADLPMPPDSDLNGLRFSPEGDRLALLGYRSIQVFDLASGEFFPLYARETDPNENFDFVRWTPDGTRIAVGIVHYGEFGDWEKESLVVLDSFTGEILNEIDDIGGPGEILPNGLTIAAHHWAQEGAGGTLSFFNLANGSLQNQIEFSFGLYTFAPSPDGEALLAFQDRDLVRFDPFTGEETWRTPLGQAHSDQVNYRLTISPDGQRAATAGRAIALWDTETGKLLEIFTGHTGIVLDMAFTPDGMQLVTTSEDGTVIVWELP